MPGVPFRRDHKAAVAVLFGIMAVPMIALVGLAIDYAIWNQTYASIALAASGAALNAVKVAAQGEVQNDPGFIAEAQQMGATWFAAQIGVAADAGRLTNVTPNVIVTPGSTLVATVTYSSEVQSIFGSAFFGIKTYPISVTAQAALPTSPFLNVEILLDDSPSMEIGATPNDIYAMQMATPCSPYGAVYGVTPNQTTGGVSAAGQAYNAYQCSGADGNYDGSLQCPIQPNTGDPNWPTSATNGLPTNYVGGQACSNLAQQTTPPQVNGQYPLAGAPCAFACHFDTSGQAGTAATHDYYRLARDTIVGPPNPSNSALCSNYPIGSNPATCQIMLRFDLVKLAVDQVISTMRWDDMPNVHNLNVGVFHFDTTVHADYPALGACGGSANHLPCEAGDDWADALLDVGTPPSTKDTADNGIQPYGGGNVPSTDFNTTVSTLLSTSFANYLTPSGDGSSATKPAKVLFLVTDGLGDFIPPGGTRVNQPFDTTLCDTLKKPVKDGGYGYTIYVVYTPYYPLMNAFYLNNTLPIAEGTGPGTIYGNLQACASDPVNDFIAANPSDRNSIANALEKFLIAALSTPARFTM
ncbi:MAG TPA: TadE/TadG family type IV pilus assembly protein [Acetobacteraceae bacterium]|nr:TadE/TadG family type IV pilus assembly protein [Acetobacteraceae bacterium]